ncbi:ABC transporter ATP-binding protein [Microlunatus soli]|uniref:Oligopeptide transport system ATP-binding protein n=1 Tax=Microlunatus soli TaxID=630515 RepID=A0A1H1WIV8_9ACTN|nr:ABC transporter ATP-binding protein [Microlunatus soli]SDS96129.1 oligopeptide transport system ATP-binding protein [Microlunatus soli]
MTATDTESRTPAPTAPLLEVDDLQVEFRVGQGVVSAVNGVSFTLEPGRTLAVVGESGSGKSVTAQAIMRLLQTPPARITGGRILFQGKDLLALPETEHRAVCGEHIAIVFQDALAALNPVYTVGFQLTEALRARRHLPRSAAKKRAIELLELVQVPNPKQRVKEYPHQFSGGMRQRVMIALALALEPEVLIADEPTTALDVTVQAQIMRLLGEIQRERQMGMILITHDLGVVAEVADQVNVMYAGRVVETATVDDIFARPGHPYTQALLRSIPRLDRKGQQLDAISGRPPELNRIPAGCPFHPRCERAEDICRTDPAPQLRELAGGRTAACHFAE